jgi:hypothetical protein
MTDPDTPPAGRLATPVDATRGVVTFARERHAAVLDRLAAARATAAAAREAATAAAAERQRLVDQFAGGGPRPDGVALSLARTNAADATDMADLTSAAVRQLEDAAHRAHVGVLSASAADFQARYDAAKADAFAAAVVVDGLVDEARSALADFRDRLSAVAGMYAEAETFAQNILPGAIVGNPVLAAMHASQRPAYRAEPMMRPGLEIVVVRPNTHAAAPPAPVASLTMAYNTLAPTPLPDPPATASDAAQAPGMAA